MNSLTKWVSSNNTQCLTEAKTMWGNSVKWFLEVSHNTYQYIFVKVAELSPKLYFLPLVGDPYFGVTYKSLDSGSLVNIVCFGCCPNKQVTLCMNPDSLSFK